MIPHAEIRFIRGRIRFGNSPNSAPFLFGGRGVSGEYAHWNAYGGKGGGIASSMLKNPLP
jgi:hypothetical protein